MALKQHFKLILPNLNVVDGYTWTGFMNMNSISVHISFIDIVPSTTQ